MASKHPRGIRSAEFFQIPLTIEQSPFQKSVLLGEDHHLGNVQRMSGNRAKNLPGALNAINGGSTRSTAVLGLGLLSLLGDGTIKPRSDSSSAKYMPVSSAARFACRESSNGSASMGGATVDEDDDDGSPCVMASNISCRATTCIAADDAVLLG